MLTLLVISNVLSLAVAAIGVAICRVQNAELDRMHEQLVAARAGVAGPSLMPAWRLLGGL